MTGASSFSLYQWLLLIFRFHFFSLSRTHANVHARIHIMHSRTHARTYGCLKEHTQTQSEL